MPVISENIWKLRGLRMRHILKVTLTEHDLHCPRQEDWNTNEHNHTVKKNID